MTKQSIVPLKMKLARPLRKYKPELLIGFGIGGTVCAIIFAVKATPKAMRIIKEKEEAEKRDLSNLEKVKTAWPYYIPSTVAWGISIACIIGANKISNKRAAALATTYCLSENAFKEYRDKVVELIGDKKENAIKDSIDKDKLDKNPKSKSEVIMTNLGDSLCFDSLSGRYFYSNIEKIRRIENEINKRMLGDISVTLNDLYYMIGIPPIGIGDDIGWSVDKGLIEMRFSSHLADDGTPCLVLGYVDPPYYGFD